MMSGVILHVFEHYHPSNRFLVRTIVVYPAHNVVYWQACGCAKPKQRLANVGALRLRIATPVMVLMEHRNVRIENHMDLSC